MAVPFRLKGSGIVLFDPGARRVRKEHSAAISAAILEDRRAVRGKPGNPYLKLVRVTSESTASAFAVLFGGSLILTGAPSPIAAVPVLLSLPLVFMGDRMVYLARLRRGRVNRKGQEPVDLGELQAEPLGKDSDR